VTLSAQNPGFLLIITGWGESGKVILQVSIAVFFRALSKNFPGKDGSAPPRKNGPYTYVAVVSFISSCQCSQSAATSEIYKCCWARVRLM